MIYLDHNSTTILEPEAKLYMLELMDSPLNPSSVHSKGRLARNIVERARRQVRNALGITTDAEYQLIFTCSGTEANNLILSNFSEEEVYISSIEHLSILEFAKRFSNVKLIKVNEDGIVDLQELDKLLEQSKSSKKLVSIMLANNETGVIQPIKEATQIAHSYGAMMHSDCSQAIGKIPVDIMDMGIDFATVSAHKIGGPIGAAALIARSCYTIRPLLIGGRQEKGMRSGTENSVAIAGFGLAAEIASKNVERRAERMRNMQAKLEYDLLSSFSDVKIIARNSSRLPNTSLILMPGVDSQLQVIAFDLRGICVSSGAACSSGKVSDSHVLRAMNMKTEEVTSAVRVSTNYEQKTEDIENFVSAFKEIYQTRRLV